MTRPKITFYVNRYGELAGASINGVRVDIAVETVDDGNPLRTRSDGLLDLDRLAKFAPVIDQRLAPQRGHDA